MQNLNFSLPNRKLVFYLCAFIIGSYFLFLGLKEAQAFLGPLVTAVILALVVLPLCQRFENTLNRTWASLAGTFLIFLASLIVVGVVFFQLVSFTNDWPEIKKTMKPKIEQLQDYVVTNTPVERKDLPSLSSGDEQDSQNQEPQADAQQSASGNKQKGSGFASGLNFGSMGSQLGSMLMGMVGFFGTYLLCFVYIYFLLRYRSRFKNFLIRVTKKRDQIKGLLSKFAKVTNQYLVGKLVLMGLLAVVYSIGLGISGVSNFILVSIIAAVLTLIPYIGNIIGFVMAILFGYLTTGDFMTLVGIALTFTVSQFIESYVLMPFVVGDRVDVHPFFVIVGVIIANLLWGVIGMVLAIPVLAIITILLLHIDRTEALGVFLSKKKMKPHD